MENQKDNKELIILVCFLCVLVLALGGYIVYDKIIVKDNNTKQNINNASKDENSKSNERWRESLEDYFIRNGTTYTKPNRIYNYPQIISEKKDAHVSEFTSESGEVYKAGNYYIILTWFDGGTALMEIYDENAKMIVTSSIDGNTTPLIVDNNIYYGIVDCPQNIGTRTTGEEGMIVPIYKLNTTSQKITKEFNLDHNAGWAC